MVDILFFSSPERINNIPNTNDLRRNLLLFKNLADIFEKYILTNPHDDGSRNRLIHQKKSYKNWKLLIANLAFEEGRLREVNRKRKIRKVYRLISSIQDIH